MNLVDLWDELLSDPYFVGIILPMIAAVLATFVVEWIAKPWLDARKERILHSRLQTEKLVWAFQKVSLAISFIDGARRLAEAESDKSLQDALTRGYQSRINDVITFCSDLDSVVSELSLPYINKNKEAVENLSLYVGILKGAALRAQAVGDTDTLVNRARDANKFDTYFRVFVGFADSQENLLKRLYWKKFQKRKYLHEQNAYLGVYRKS